MLSLNFLKKPCYFFILSFSSLLFLKAFALSPDLSNPDLPNFWVTGTAAAQPPKPQSLAIWSTPVVVTSGAQSANISLDSNSTATAVWVSEDAKTLFSSSLPSTQTQWPQTATTVFSSSTSQKLYHPIVFGDLNKAILWMCVKEDSIATVDRLQVSRNSLDPNNWSTPLNIDLPLHVGAWLIDQKADREGNLIAGWVRESRINSVITSLSTLTAEAYHWTPPLVVDSSLSHNQELCKPVFAIIKGQALAIWKINTPDLAFQWARYDFSKNKWEETFTSSFPSIFHDILDIEVAMDEKGNAVATFITVLSNKKQALYASRLNATMNSWSAFQSLSDPNNCADFAQVAMDQAGHAIVLWTERQAQSLVNGPESLKSATMARSGKLSQPFVIVDNPVSIRSFQLVVNCPGSAVAIWENEGEGSVRVSTKPIGNNWSPAFTLSDTGSSSRVALNDHGDAIAIWEESSLDKQIIMSSSSFNAGCFR